MFTKFHRFGPDQCQPVPTIRIGPAWEKGKRSRENIGENPWTKCKITQGKQKLRSDCQIKTGCSLLPAVHLSPIFNCK